MLTWKKQLDHHNEYPDGQNLLLISLKFFIASLAIKIWYWFSWCTRFLDGFYGIETNEVIGQVEEFWKFGLLRSNIVRTDFNVFINRNRLLSSPFWSFLSSKSFIHIYDELVGSQSFPNFIHIFRRYYSAGKEKTVAFLSSA